MGNCFSSEKAASPDAQPATPAIRREKAGSLPHIEPTGGKLSTSVELSEKPEEDVPPLPTAIPSVPTVEPQTSTLDSESASPQARKFSEFKNPREPPKTPPQVAAEEHAVRRGSATGTIDSGKAMSADGRSVKESTVEAVEEVEKPEIPEKAASRHASVAPLVATPPSDAEEEKEPSVATEKVEIPATVEEVALPTSPTSAEPVVPAALGKEETTSPVEETAGATKIIPTTAEELAAESSPTDSTLTATEEAVPEEPLSEAKKTSSLPQLNTTLPAAHEATTDAVPATASSTASPSSLKSPHTDLTQQETAQTSPPTSARPMTASSYKGSLSLFPAETKHEPSSSPVIVPITPQNTTIDPSAPPAGLPSRTQSTVDARSEKSKRQSRISRMFSVGVKKDRSIPELPIRTASKKQHAIVEEKAIPPVPAIQTIKAPRPLSNDAKRSSNDASSIPPLASPTEAVSPSLEGRKWNQEGDNESLYCY